MVNKLKDAFGMAENNPHRGGDDILYPSTPTAYQKEPTANQKRGVYGSRG